jgi:hypothetical protein
MAATKLQARPRTLHYRRATIIGGDPTDLPPDLQSLVATAIARKRSAKELRQHDQREQQAVRVIKPPYTRDTLLCGVMLDYTEGSSQPILELDEEDEEMTLLALSPKERQHFLSSLLYFAIEGNDVILMQSRALAAGHFENYLNWLLSERAEVLKGGAKLFLSPLTPRDTRRELERVRWVELQDAVQGGSFLVQTEQTPKPTNLFGGIKAGLRAAWQTEGAFRERLTVNDALAAEEIQVSVRIALPRGRRKAQLLDDVAHVLRHTDDALVRVRTNRGDYSGGKLRLAKDVRIQVDAGGLPVLFDVGRKMQEYLIELRQGGELDPDIE